MRLAGLLRQAASYGAVGLAALGLDWALFVLLTWCGLPVVAANLASRIAGAVVAFWLNGTVTFRDERGGRLGWARFRRFALSWVLVTALGSLGLDALVARFGLGMAWAAKPFVEVALAGVSFLLYRYWIYR